MNLNFDIWNIQKKKINNENASVYFHEREIRYAFLGRNIGSEQNGSGQSSRRPVLVLRKFNQYIAVILPLTTKKKKALWCFQIKEGSYVILSQIRLIDGKRLAEKIGKMDKDSFQKLKQQLRLVLGL